MQAAQGSEQPERGLTTAFEDDLADVDSGPSFDEAAFRDYMGAVAEMRFVVRKLIRIADEAAGRFGLDPLAHQALIQIAGAGPDRMRVSDLAERLDIVPAFTSRILTMLERFGLVERRRSEHDRRVVTLRVTPAGLQKLYDVNEVVTVDMQRFVQTLSHEQRDAAVEVMSILMTLGDG